MAGRSETAKAKAGEDEQQILVRFGQRIRALRQARHLSQEDLALNCGLDRTYVSGIERGKRNVSLLNIQLLAKTLEVPIANLFEGI